MRIVPGTSPTATAGAQVSAEADGAQDTDAALVRRWRDGQSAAGDALVRRYDRPLIRYLQRLTGSDHVAEELHQATWLSVLEHLDRFDGAAEGGFKAWLFRIATNKANDLWRSRGRERAAKAGLRLMLDQEYPEAGHRTSAVEQERKLQAAIDRLPDAQREVLLLRYYGQMKFVEIAQVLGCPLNTALGRMHKAMLKLKEMMEA